MYKIKATFQHRAEMDDGYGSSKSVYLFKFCRASSPRMAKPMYIGGMVGNVNKTFKRARLQKNAEYEISCKSIGMFNPFFAQITHPTEITKINS